MLDKTTKRVLCAFFCLFVFFFQQTSGADLALLMLDVLEKSKTEPTEEHITRIARYVEPCNNFVIIVKELYCDVEILAARITTSSD